MCVYIYTHIYIYSVYKKIKGQSYELTSEPVSQVEDELAQYGLMDDKSDGPIERIYGCVSNWGYFAPIDITAYVPFNVEHEFFAFEQ